MSRILVVDDDEDIRESIGEILTVNGHEVETAENGRDALAKLEAAPELPRLVFLDMMMPEMTGGQLLVALSAHPRFRSLPVVLLSANVVSPAEAPGARRIVQKPVTDTTLLELIRDFGDP